MDCTLKCCARSTVLGSPAAITGSTCKFKSCFAVENPQHNSSQVGLLKINELEFQKEVLGTVT